MHAGVCTHTHDMSSQHVAWGSSHHWNRIFSMFSSFSQVISSEDSDSPAAYGDLFPSSGVLSGIVS